MATPYTGNPTAVQAPASAPGPGVAPIVSLIQDADGNTAANLYQAWKVLADYIAYLNIQGVNSGFGDGSDGAATLDGTNTVSWASKVGSVYTMTRDAYLTTLTVTGASTQLVANGYRIWCKLSLTTAANAIIQANGAAGSSGTGGASGPTGQVNAGSSGGGGGGSLTPGQVGTTITLAAGGQGGTGGDNAGHANLGGTGGTITNTVPTNDAGVRLFTPHLLGYISGPALGGSISITTPTVAVLAPGGGSGGGGGAGGSGGQGGGGGGGGGVLAIAAKNVTLLNNTDLQAKGGAGAAAVSGNSGGGGGGGGGLLILAYASLTVGSGSLSSATNCAGGAGGALSGTGFAGNTGATGLYVPIQLA